MSRYEWEEVVVTIVCLVGGGYLAAEVEALRPGVLPLIGMVVAFWFNRRNGNGNGNGKGGQASV